MNELAELCEKVMKKLPLRVAWKQNGEDWFAYTTSEEWADVLAKKSKGKVEQHDGNDWVPWFPPEDKADH